MSEENEDTTGYVLASEHAALNNMEVEEVIKQIKNGTLQGRIVNNLRYVKSGWVVPTNFADIGAETRASAKADEDFMKSLKPVKIVEIDLSFGNIFELTFKAAISGILVSIVIGLPVFIAFAAMVD